MICFLLLFLQQAKSNVALEKGSGMFFSTYDGLLQIFFIAIGVFLWFRLVILVFLAIFCFN